MPEALQAMPTNQEIRLSRSFESTVETIARMLRARIQENEIEAVKKVNPNKAAHIGDLLVSNADRY